MPISNAVLQRIQYNQLSARAAPPMPSASPPPMEQASRQQGPAPAPTSHPVEQQSQQAPEQRPPLHQPTRYAAHRIMEFMSSREANTSPARQQFGMIYPSAVQRQGDLVLLRWVNTTGAPAQIQFAQGESSTILSLSVNGRTLYAGTVEGGSPRVDFAKMLEVPDHGVVTMLVRAVGMAGSPAAALGTFTNSSTSTGATAATTTSTAPAPSKVGIVLDTLWMGCLAAIPVGGLLYVAGKKDLGKKVAKVGAIGFAGPLVIGVPVLMGMWILGSAKSGHA